MPRSHKTGYLSDAASYWLVVATGSKECWKFTLGLASLALNAAGSYSTVQSDLYKSLQYQ